MSSLFLLYIVYVSVNVYKYFKNRNIRILSEIEERWQIPWDPNERVREFKIPANIEEINKIPAPQSPLAPEWEKDLSTGERKIEDVDTDEELEELELAEVKQKKVPFDYRNVSSEDSDNPSAMELLRTFFILNAPFPKKKESKMLNRVGQDVFKHTQHEVFRKY